MISLLSGLLFGAAAVAAPTTFNKRAPSGVPQYVVDYAPLVWLDDRDVYRPSDIAAQVDHTTPKVDRNPISGYPQPLTLSNLDALNSYGDGGENVYLTSNDDVTTVPDWLTGAQPNAEGETEGAKTAVVITVDHGGGKLDAFYMYFWAFNWGGTVLDINLGNHVGDWEHNMIRFQDGEPQALWYSQHSRGQAFEYQAVEKEGKRPYAYAANGTHALYAMAGTHDHTIPNLNLPAGFLEDHTQRGTLWDPALSAYWYSFNPSDQTFTPYDGAPVAYLNYKGRWGDDRYPDSDSRQFNFFGFRRYEGGPTGPKFKTLDRELVCPDNDPPCIVLPIKVPRE
ncbi:hypothetical protein BDY21DRAFT_172151 [Lineolata rhizophorae]|uniref:Vacuolar protein sorting-associated protein 62 n=1 Tax=Lineolata rhizophorae TaxID=578093 RepID=A0A6A6NL34_9PEZI|nr:hypothetical protein BDY21DRAFT_172151 [Lineolata rhizophorae]